MAIIPTDWYSLDYEEATLIHEWKTNALKEEVAPSSGFPSWTWCNPFPPSHIWCRIAVT